MAKQPFDDLSKEPEKTTQSQSKAKKTTTEKHVGSKHRPTRQMWARAMIVLIGMIVLAFGVIVFQLAMLQIVETEDWQRRATEQQLTNSIISPNRGTIYDTNMDTLAESMQVWTVIMDPNNIDDDADRKKIADDLSVLLDVDRNDLYKKACKVESQYEVVKAKIERPTAEKLIAWVEENEMGNIFRLITDYKRTYPYGSLLSCVLGFTGDDNTGLYGLEAEYNSVLQGEAGRIVTAQNGWGDELPTSLSYEKTVDAEDGNSIVLSIDQNIQHYAEKYLDEALLQTGATNRACAIVMEVDTGSILAMATKGDYDPNDPMTITNPDEASMVAALAGDEASEARRLALEKQWTNKAISEYYEPGSVFKMFTTAMAMEEGLISEQSHFMCEGLVDFDEWQVHCHVFPGNHGDQTLSDAISNSCNPAFIKIGTSVGNELFYRYYSGFGFTERTGIDMLGEGYISESLYHSEEELGEVQLAVSSMGQTFKVTPIQMITAISAIANGGQLLEPYVVKQVLDADGNVLSNTSATVKRQVISTETATRVSELLRVAVESGGGKNAYVAGYRVAGKTGTSEKTESDGKNVVASFGGFAPADDPRVAVLVMIDEPQCDNRYGGTIAAPVAKKILEDTLPYLGIEPQYTAEELTDLNRSTPAVEGLDVASAEAAINGEGLVARIQGNGPTVLRQVPSAGQTIPAEGTVVLYTDEESVQSSLVEVPDFSGKTVTQATELAAASDLNIQLNGVDLESGEALASTQSVEAGQLVSYGTIVTIDFIYEDQIE